MARELYWWSRFFILALTIAAACGLVAYLVVAL